MNLRKFNNKGEIISSEIIKWILYLAILAAAGFAIKNIISKF